MPKWDTLPPEVLQQINGYLGNPGIPVVLGALALINEEALEDFMVRWETTSDVIFVGDVWTPGYHYRIRRLTVGGKRVRLSDVRFTVSIEPGYVFQEDDVGEIDVELTLLPGLIRGIRHGAYTSVKKIGVRRRDKELKGKNSSKEHQQALQLENAMLCFVMTASVNKVEPAALPIEEFSKTFYLAIYRIIDVAQKAIAKDHYSSEAMYTEELEECPGADELRLLRVKIRKDVDQVINFGYRLLAFLETTDVEALESMDPAARKKSVIYSRTKFLALYEDLEAWADRLPDTLSKLERLFQLARKGTKVSEHTVGSLFLKNKDFAKEVVFKHLKAHFELDNPEAGLGTLRELDQLMAKMAEYAKRLMGKVGDGLEVDEQGIKIIQLLEQARTEIVLVAASSGCSSLKAALLDPTGPFFTMFNKLSAQSCADKREDLWSKFVGWWREMSEATQKTYG